MDSRSTDLHIDQNKLLIFSENENKFCRNEKKLGDFVGESVGAKSFLLMSCIRWGGANW